MPDRVLIANGQGFWGDSILAPVRLVREGPLDYLTLDYLAEVTMSVLQKQRARDPKRGYAHDFVALCERILPEAAKKGVKIVANAGGVNPRACMEAVLEVASRQGLEGLRVGIVHGDDVLDRVPELVASGHTLENIDTGCPLADVQDRLTSANAYIGADGVRRCLDDGADVVIGGRVADPSLIVGPLLHEFGWDASDWDKVAAATVAGHVIECGTQSTGANYTDWRKVEGWANIGYPVADVRPDGTFWLTKHEGTGGLVTRDTVAHQLLYEIGDPRRFLSPDCTVDFTSLELTDDGPHRVRIDSVRGGPPTDSYKVSISYQDGFKAIGQLVISGPEALDKARLCAEVVFDRLALDGVTFEPEQKLVELLGTGVCHAGMVAVVDAPEVVLRIGVHDADRKKVDRFGMEIAPLVTSGPPGVTGYAGGRPKASDVIAYWPALLARSEIRVVTEVEEVR